MNTKMKTINDSIQYIPTSMVRHTELEEDTPEERHSRRTQTHLLTYASSKVFTTVGRVFSNSPGDLGSIPVRVTPKT